MPTALYYTLAGLLTVTVFWVYGRSKRGRMNLPLPPGPKGWPLIGNLRDIPSSFEWLTYHKWSKEYGSDILHLNLAGTSFIILDTAEVATDLLDKRSTIYSGKPRMPMVNELMGLGWSFPLMNYGETWRQHRRLMHQTFNHVAARQFRPYILRSVRCLLKKVLDEPESNIQKIIKRMAGEIIMAIAYGIDVPMGSKQYIYQAEAANDAVLRAAQPGGYWVDSLPILKHVPEWMPGAGFQRKAREVRQLTQMVLEEPFAATKKHMASGTAAPSFTTLSLEEIQQGSNDHGFTEFDIKCVAATMYSAGTDTIQALISNCILGLLSNPTALRKAHKEIDSVLQPGHLPDFHDEESLPYVTAILKEGLRWNSIAPFILHTSTADDEYKGYFIPAGSIVIANTWAMLHNEKAYPEPSVFNPDRFIKDGKLDESVLHPDHAIWGFGRRACPGRHMAYDQAWMTVASLITAFDIKKPLDAHGNTIDPSYEYTTGLLSQPKPYKVLIKPRSKSAEMMIRESAMQEY